MGRFISSSDNLNTSELHHCTWDTRWDAKCTCAIETACYTLWQWVSSFSPTDISPRETFSSHDKSCRSLEMNHPVAVFPSTVSEQWNGTLGNGRRPRWKAFEPDVARRIETTMSIALALDWDASVYRQWYINKGDRKSSCCYGVSFAAAAAAAVLWRQLRLLLSGVSKMKLGQVIRLWKIQSYVFDPLLLFSILNVLDNVA